MLFVALTLSAALAWTPANTSVNSTDGHLRISGQTGNARHTHGGKAAQLGEARFRVQHDRKAPITLSVNKIVFLRGHSCDKPPTDPVSEPAFGGILLEGAVESKQTVSIPPGKEVSLNIGFQPVEAYYTHCDRFAFAVTFQAGDEALDVLAETNVMRMEPYRPK